MTAPVSRGYNSTMSRVSNTVLLLLLVTVHGTLAGAQEVQFQLQEKSVVEQRLSKALNLPLTAVNVDRVGSADSEQFRAKKIPAITIHSLTQETLRVLHSPEDKLSRIKLSDYYDTYHLVAALLAYLDATWPPAPTGRAQPSATTSATAQ